MDTATGTLSLFLPMVLMLTVGFFILYFIIKNAVKNGMIAAEAKMHNQPK